ncbi:MAG TPA: hypothetical protein VLA49_05885 [Anaerolineales bacterium]|nr:hypothetical protein [Anaerolineales bacterium]
MKADSHLQPALTFNGINGATGGYLLPGMTPTALASIASGEIPDRNHIFDLKLRLRKASDTARGIKEGYSPLDLSQAGWGVIFAFQDQDRLPEIKEALGELLDLRKSQAGDRYREFTGPDAYRPGESKADFLARLGTGPGPADPEKIPYYLLIVAGPESIPFAFQYQLDVQYAVGRLHFDILEDYAHYARSVVQMESGSNRLPRSLAFFGVRHEADRPTELSASQLVSPLAEQLAREEKKTGWTVQSVVGEAASKQRLAELAAGSDAPALLFSASHGMGFPADDPRQHPHQGALLCSDWPGPEAWQGPIPEEHYFSGDDLPSEASLLGRMGFYFACYGAGTPQMDDFSYQARQAPAVLAGQPFVARLPQRLLSHPKGGMLAVIGHVERTWSYSFNWQRAGSQLAVFESTLKRLMSGQPVGYAMEYFNERYAELSTELTAELQGMRLGKIVDPLDLAGAWTANNDARSYVIVGDPAARLAVEPQEKAETAVPDTQTIVISTTPAKKPSPPLVPEQAEPDSIEKEIIRAEIKLGDLYLKKGTGNRQSNRELALSHYQEALALALEMGDEQAVRYLEQRISRAQGDI